MEPITLNGRSYRRPARPTVVICADGCDPSLSRSGARGRGAADDRALARGRVLRAGRGGDADLHQPEQPLDRHRRAALGARHLGQFRARPRQRRRDHDERPGDGARRDDPRADVAGRGRRRGGHRQGQAAPHARAQRAGHLLFVGTGRSLHPGRARHRGGRGAGRAAQARHVFGRPVAVRARRRHPPRRTAPRPAALSVAVRLRAARPRPRTRPRRWNFTAPSTTASRASRRSAASSR